MKLTNPSLTLNFLGSDLPSGHGGTQTIDLCDIIKGSIRRRPQLLNGLRSSGSTVDIAISRDCLLTEDIIATDGDIEATLKDGSTVIFTGFLSTKYTWTITDHGEEALSLTLEDRGARLLDKPFISEGYHLFNTTAKNAISAVCVACGITISSGAKDITTNVYKVVDSSVTCKQIIDDILYECNHVYYFNNLGQMEFFEIDVTSTSGTTIGSDKLIVRNGEAVSLSKSVRTYRSARVTYTALATADNYLVYRNTTGQNDSHPYCYIELQPGEHFDGAEIYTAQEWAAATADTYRQPTLISAVNADSETSKVGSNTIVSISNVVANVEKSDDITATIIGYGVSWRKIDCENTGDSVAYITRLDAYASIVYESSINIIKAGVDGSSNPMQLDETVSYIHSKNDTVKHANLLSQYNAYCNSEYTFFSRERLDLGDIVQLEDTTYTGLSVAVMVIALTEYDYTSVIEYQAIGVSVFDLDKEAYYQTQDKGKSDTKGQSGESTRWYDGTALTGTTYARGAAGKVNDYYLNTETGDVYMCILSGGLNTAYWQYLCNIKGQDASVLGYTYELEYGLSKSDSECIFPDAVYGYDSTHTYGYETDKEYGFNNYVWSPTVDGWYHGLYVWQRIKITDAEGNINYEEPTFARELTQSLEDACVIEVTSFPDAYTSNMRRTDSQYLSLKLQDIGYKGTLILTTNEGVFASYDSEEGTWTDLTNALTIILNGSSVITDYGIKLPYAYNGNVSIDGSFAEWTLDEFSIPSLSICPSIVKNPVIQMKPVSAKADLPTSADPDDADSGVLATNNLIDGDYVITKYVTLTPDSGTYYDDVGDIATYDSNRTYYTRSGDTFSIASISAFDGTTTYYFFRVFPWRYNGSSQTWVRTENGEIKYQTVSNIVKVAREQQSLFSDDVDYHDCLYAYEAYIEELSVGLINAGDILAHDIKSYNYSEASDGTPITGYLLHHGEDAETDPGDIRSVGGIFSNMNVRGVLNLTRGNGTAGAQIRHPALETMDAVKGDPTGKDSMLNAWSAYDLLQSVGGASNSLAIYPSFDSEDSTVDAIAIRNTDSQPQSAFMGQRIRKISSGTFSTNFSVSMAFANPGGGDGDFSIAVIGLSSNTSIGADGLVTIYKNGTLIGDWDISQSSSNLPLNIFTFSSSLTWNEGDNISVEFDPGSSITVSGDCLLMIGSDYARSLSSWMGNTFPYKGVYTHDSNGWQFLGFSTCYDPSDAHDFSVYTYDPCFYETYRDPFITEFDTAQNVNYSFPTTLAAYSYYDDDSVPPVRHNLVQGATYRVSGLFYDASGNQFSPTFMTVDYLGSQISVAMSNGVTYVFNVNVGSPLYGHIAISETAAGVEMMGQYPKDDNIYDVGSPTRRWLTGYISSLPLTSKRSEKRDIAVFERRALDVLKDVEIVRFKFIKDKRNTPLIGFIADDTDSDLSGEGHDSMMVNNCIAVLIKAVQELSEEIEKLKGGNN